MVAYKINKIDETKSTNDLLKQLICKEQLTEGYTIVALTQTAGKGQLGAYWESAPKQNITMSILLRPEFIKANQMFLVSKVVSLGIVSYLNTHGEQFKIKWPNDIYFNDKKICGVLIENQLMGDSILYSVVGIGLNVNQEFFVSDAPNPISLHNIFNRKFDIDNEILSLLKQIESWYQLLADGGEALINKHYFANLYRTDAFYQFKTAEGVVFNGKITNVETNGKLSIIDTQNKTREFLFKEVEFII